MYAKIRINGDILVKTGMHIGGSSAFAAIGAVDSPIVRDVRSNLPFASWKFFKRQNEEFTC
mgnify:CR=1 FL=1